MCKGISTIIKYSGVAALVLALAGMSMNLCCKKNDKIGVLDNDKILTTAAPFQAILGEENKYLNALSVRQAEDEKMLQAELLALQQKIKLSGKPESVFQKEVNEFRQKVIFYNQKYQIQRNLIAQASQIARQQLDPFVREVLNELGKEGYTIIVPKQNLTYYMSSADVTAQFIQRLDSKKMTISFPDPAQLNVAQTAQAQVNESDKKQNDNGTKVSSEISDTKSTAKTDDVQSKTIQPTETEKKEIKTVQSNNEVKK